MTERRFAKPTSVCSRPSRLPRIGVAAAGLAAALALLPGASQAAVEFVTGVGNCNKVDTQNDNQRLSVQAGDNMRFEVWGDGIDIGRAVRVTSVGNPADDLVTARIVRAHNGVENLLRGCRIAKGSVEVEVDSPAHAGATRIRTLHFRMPAGDESSLAVRVEPHRVPTWTFRGVDQSPANCLGSVVMDLGNSRATLTLRPGASTDTSNCTVRFRTSIVVADQSPAIDIQQSFNYAVQFPAYLRLATGSNITSPGALSNKDIAFDGNVASIRAIQSPLVSTLVVRTPNPNRSDTLTLAINPSPITFTQACDCNNPRGGGNLINTGGEFRCQVRLSQQPPANGQLISIAAPAGCVSPATGGGLDLNTATGQGSFTATGPGTSHVRFFLATSNNPACAGTVPVPHWMKFWVGPRGAETGPAYTRCQIRIRIPS
ncbi:MAG: hypothetical protein IT503_18845 [Burkholderiaceae bacterium]|nr:hypothetical protein [Burkholderiaceae bacterium]